MFSEISWSTYISSVVVLSAAYYLFVIVKYYREDLSQFLAGKKIAGAVNFIPKPEVFEKQNNFLLAQSLADEIRAFFNEAGNQKISKEEATASMRLLLRKNFALKDSSFKESIQNLIEKECASNFAVHLNEVELSALWN